MTKNKDNKILWDSKNDCFVYMKKGATKPTYLPNTQEVKDVEDVDYFEILNELPADGKIPDSQTYSVYLAGKSTIPSVTTKVGLDVGKNTVDEVTFTNDKKVSVLINTNGGKLTVNASKASVTHRGVATIVTINAVATKSYHENGKADQINLKAGRVVVEGKAEVGSVLITATDITDTTDGKNVSVEVEGTASLGAVAADNETAAGKLASAVSGTTDVMKAVANSNGFAGGFGTEKAPYLVATADQFYSISKLFSSASGNGYYFKQVADIEVTKAASRYFSGTYDGNGYAIIAADSVTDRDFISLFGIPFANTTLKNINTYSAEKVALTLTSENWDTLSSLKFINIDVYAKEGVDLVKTTQANFAYFMYGCAYAPSSNQSYEFEDCNVYANLYSANRCAAYVGAFCFTDNLYVKMRNCVNKANISSPQWAAVIAVNTYANTPTSFDATSNNVSKFFDIDATVKNEGIISGNHNKNHSGLVGVVIETNAFTKALHEYAKTIGGKYDVVIGSMNTSAELYWDNGFKVVGGESQNIYGLYIGDITYNVDHNSRAGGAWAEKVTSVSENAVKVTSIKIVSKNDSVVTDKEVNYNYIFDGSVKCGFVVIDSQVYCVIDVLQVDSSKLKTYLTVLSNGTYVSYSKLG